MITLHSRVWVESDMGERALVNREPFEVCICDIEARELSVSFAFNTVGAYVATHCAGGTFSVMRDGSRPRYRTVRPVGWTLDDVDDVIVGEGN